MGTLRLMVGVITLNKMNERLDKRGSLEIRDIGEKIDDKRFCRLKHIV